MQNYRPYAGVTPAVKMLITINVIMYFLSMFVEKKFHIDLTHTLGLHLPQSVYWGPWQYVTHMFMHGGADAFLKGYIFEGLSHLFFNMFALYMFGRILESVWGSKRFLIFYFVCGIGAGLLNSVVGWYEIHRLNLELDAFRNTPDPGLLADFIRNHISHPAEWLWQVVDDWKNNPASQDYILRGEQIYERIIDMQVNIPMIGASGAIFGILIAFGMLFPNTELYFMFIPVPIKAKYFVIGYGALELYMGMQNNVGDNVAHFAHLGGMLFGFILVKFWSRNRKSFY